MAYAFTKWEWNTRHIFLTLWRNECGCQVEHYWALMRAGLSRMPDQCAPRTEALFPANQGLCTLYFLISALETPRVSSVGEQSTVAQCRVCGWSVCTPSFELLRTAWSHWSPVTHTGNWISFFVGNPAWKGWILNMMRMTSGFGGVAGKWPLGFFAQTFDAHLDMKDHYCIKKL